MKKIFLFLIIMFNSQNFVLAQCFAGGDYLPNGYLVSNLNNYNIDNFVKNEVIKLKSFFNTNVDFFYLKEYQGSNAMFTPVCSGLNCEGTICLGINLFSESYWKNQSYLVIATLAHEFAHSLQYKYNFNSNYKWPELHADFLAGYYIGKTYSLTKSQLDAFMFDFGQNGDFYLYDAGHHGTPRERSCAFYEGYRFVFDNGGDINSAFQAATSYVISNKPCGIQEQKKINEVNDNIKNNQVGNLKVVVRDGSRYVIQTNNNLDVLQTYPLNVNRIKIKNELGVRGSISQYFHKAQFLRLENLSSNQRQVVLVYKVGHNFLTGYSYKLVNRAEVPIEKGKTTVVYIYRGNARYNFE